MDNVSKIFFKSQLLFAVINLYSKPNAELKMHKTSSITVKPVVKHRKLLQWRRSPC
ncbi:hypothetical protein [Nostoc sp.]|uniref:hypothetical protein n=1 Tax=Nostoc sp. TaxID=1180 RepID=UPI002FF903FD